jgi:hypothetical protein
MKRALMMGALLTLGISGARADIIACPGMTTLSYLVTLNTPENACYSQDKLFWDFSYDPGPGAPGASDVNATLIFQPAGAFDIHGWNFAATWAQNAAGLANFELGYSIQVCATGVCAGPPGANIFAADATYAPSAFGAGDQTVLWSTGTGATLTQGSPGALPVAANIGLPPGGTTAPISVTANFSGTGAITGTNLRFYQHVVPEPEPVGIVVAGLALLMIAAIRPRTRQSN